MLKSVRVLLASGAFLASAGAAWAQASNHQPPTPATNVPVPGFTLDDPKPGMPGGSPASSGSNVGANVGAGVTAAPVGNDVRPPGAAPDVAEAPKARPLFGLSRELP